MASLANDRAETGDRQPSNLSRLNDAERRVLLLLAEGHTAKSIANTTGSSTASVNERLREARRKTGVSSSRELARQLKAQENRDEQIGVSNASSPSASQPRLEALTRRRRKGLLAMTGILTVAAIAATTMVTQQADAPAATPRWITDRDIGTFTVEGPAWLYERIRIEPRDPAWAPGAERALRERYASVRFFDAKPRILRITCREQTCEVAASVPEARLGSGYGDEEPAIIRDMRKRGLIHTGAIITSDPATSAPIFLSYYLKAD